ncbi:uncharacterized protein LOC128874647 isoform X2 [Hylaeus volcanicus]|nr:uncharacterized protein LOC128874647 isoform X2 [Hylaeus volcanicus]
MVSSREAELSKCLPPQKHVLLPDVLQEHIAQNVGFTSSRQTFRPTVEPLQPVRIYTVHDNIDITEQTYSPYYSSLNDSTMYNILLKPTEHQGYVQLQLLEEFTTQKDNGDLSSIAENDDELYSDGDSVYGPKSRSNILFRRPKQSLSRRSNPAFTKSLPNLRDEVEALSAGALSRSNRDLQNENDSENGSSTEESRLRNKKIWTKLDLPAVEQDRQRQSSKTKPLRSASQSLISSVSSGYKSDTYGMDSDSSCNRSQSSRRMRSSNSEEVDERYITSAELPARCFKQVTYTTDGRIYDPKDEKKQLMNSKQRRIKQALNRHNYNLFYVSSTAFMKHFINVFTYRLADCFGFDQECIEDVRREGCVLYCDKIMVSDDAFKYSRVEQYEIIPAVWLQWPICAQEWLDRPRSTWPDYNDVEKIKDCGCYVTPEGFVPKRGSSNIIEDLEWQLTFPTGERYLETCMTKSQVQVYLIALMLHKSFLRPVFDTMFGLTTAHIRHKLFWMIEENDRPSKWPYNRMGECLLSLLDSMYHCISQNEPTLRDYFVRDRNLFQRVPSDHLLHTQKQLKRITENPIMYVFHAMENIRYSENFFPRLDYDMLLRILTADTLTLINPALAKYAGKPMPQPSKDRSPEEDKYSKTGFWDNVKNQPKKRSVRFVTDKTLINPRKATDSIIEISMRCAELEGPRLYVLLDFFIRHFIKIAERYNKYADYQQKTLYLDHADRLSILLSEKPRHKSDARAYRDKIKVLRKKVANSKSKDDPPETPKRNLETAIFVAPLKERFAKESLEKTSTPLETRAEKSKKQSESIDHGHPKKQSESIDRAQTITQTTVHESHYQDLKETLEPTQNETPSTLTLKTHPAKKTSTSKPEPDQSEAVVTISSASDDSTYI